MMRGPSLTRRAEAVRRIREESARRIERTGRVRAFSSWCALATLAAGISLAALDARETRLQERAEAEAVARQAAAEKSLFEAKLQAIERAAPRPRGCRWAGQEYRNDELERIRQEMQTGARAKRTVIGHHAGR